MKKYLLFLCLACGCLCGGEDNLGNVSLTIPPSTIVTTSTTSTSTTLVNVETIYRIKYVYENVTLNLSKLQTQYILNMKPNICHTTGCSLGFHMAKEECITVLELDGGRFSERPKSNVLELFTDVSQNPVIPVENDSRGQFIVLDGSYWYVSRGDSMFDCSISNLSLLFGNYSNTSFVLNDLLNCSFNPFNDSIIVRHR